MAGHLGTASKLTLYFHPFSSYCQKVLIALYENGTAFEPLQVDLGDTEQRAALAEIWPFARFPVLKDSARDRILPESSIIIEYLAQHYPGAFTPIPQEAEHALDVRLWDRFFDNYVMTPMQKIVFDRIRPAHSKDPQGVADAQALLSTAYAMLDERMADREWAAGASFSLADCAAGPSLFYADWVMPLGEERPHVTAYLRRLTERPSFARAIEEAKPYRAFFPQ